MFWLNIDLTKNSQIDVSLFVSFLGSARIQESYVPERLVVVIRFSWITTVSYRMSSCFLPQSILRALYSVSCLGAGMVGKYWVCHKRETYLYKYETSCFGNSCQRVSWHVLLEWITIWSSQKDFCFKRNHVPHYLTRGIPHSLLFLIVWKKNSE